jgi:SAM-dependent methyltransferase
MKPWNLIATAIVVACASSHSEPRPQPETPRVRVNAAAPVIARAEPLSIAEPENPFAIAEPLDTEPGKNPDVVYVPTPQPVVDRMLELAQVKKSDLVYDLGCGDGRIVVTAAKRYGARAIGFDIDPARVAEAQKNVRDSGVGHLVTIEKKDIFTLDLRPASVVTLYLLPELNVKLIPQLRKMKPGSRIVSHDFDMSGIKPLVHETLSPPGTSREHEVYLWHTPLQAEETSADAP